MKCVSCSLTTNVKKQNYLCQHCGEICCYNCGLKTFNLCPTCKEPRSKKVPKDNLLKLLEKNPYHPNRSWIYYSAADDKSLDNKTLFKLYQKASTIPGAMDYIGYAYYKGFPETGGVDYVKARYWLTMAAENNISNSFFELAKIYDNGLGVPKDPFRASTLLFAGGTLGNKKCRQEFENRARTLKGFKLK